jgi:hypothetical protein
MFAKQVITLKLEYHAGGGLRMMLGLLHEMFWRGGVKPDAIVDPQHGQRFEVKEEKARESAHENGFVMLQNKVEFIVLCLPRIVPRQSELGHQ